MAETAVPPLMTALPAISVPPLMVAEVPSFPLRRTTPNSEPPFILTAVAPVASAPISMCLIVSAAVVALSAVKKLLPGSRICGRRPRAPWIVIGTFTLSVLAIV